MKFEVNVIFRRFMGKLLLENSQGIGMSKHCFHILMEKIGAELNMSHHHRSSVLFKEVCKDFSVFLLLNSKCPILYTG